MTGVSTRRLKKEAKLEERLLAERRQRRHRFARWVALYGTFGLLVVGGGAFLIAKAVTAKAYPPTGMQDHMESHPSCQICSAPIPEALQRHILEHRDPGGKGDGPGVLVQYSCSPCPDVVAKLTRIVERFPKGVYLAPYPRMSPRIALTTLGQVEAVDEVDEARIVALIQKHW